VSNCKSGQRVLFSIVNFSKSRSLFREGMSPLVRALHSVSAALTLKP
jgi:hypothetical protein